jgi:hypothetical protein
MPFEAALAASGTMAQDNSVLRAVQCLMLLVTHAPEDYLGRLLRHLVSRLETGHSDYVMSVDTWTFSPEEMSVVLSDREFANVLSSREGGLTFGLIERP